jgi:hypothetical protein
MQWISHDIQQKFHVKKQRISKNCAHFQLLSRLDRDLFAHVVSFADLPGNCIYDIWLSTNADNTHFVVLPLQSEQQSRLLANFTLQLDILGFGRRCACALESNLVMEHCSIGALLPWNTYLRITAAVQSATLHETLL